jgi:hypothetical protein
MSVREVVRTESAVGTGVLGGSAGGATETIDSQRLRQALARALSHTEPSGDDFRWNVQVSYDTAIGRDLFVRGTGKGLSWEKGVPLVWMGSNTWILPAGVGEEGKEYKILYGDSVWEQGRNHVLSRVGPETVTPVFKADEMASLSSSDPKTRLQVRCELPEGVKMFIRGSGGGLHWDHGMELKMIAPGIWELPDLALTEARVEFKLLAGDTVWETGANHVLEKGKGHIVDPAFKTEEIASLVPAKPKTTLEILSALPEEAKLFVRGSGGGLSWDRGVELRKVGTNTWEFPPLEETGPIEYKLLVDDALWEQGPNHMLSRGTNVSIDPVFETRVDAGKVDDTPAATCDVASIATLRLTDKDRRDITTIVRSMGEDSLAALAVKGLSLTLAGNRIKPVHPFVFLAYIFKDPVLAPLMSKIREDKYRWGQFMEGVSKKMTAEMGRHNLIPYLQSFSTETGRDNREVARLVILQKWEEFVSHLIDTVQ